MKVQSLNDGVFAGDLNDAIDEKIYANELVSVITHQGVDDAASRVIEVGTCGHKIE